MVAARLPAGRFLCTPAGAVAVSRRRLRRLLLGLALPMATLALWLLFDGRYGAAALSLGVSFLAWFAWRMSGDLDAFWLEIEDGELAVQMRRRREAVALGKPAIRVLEIDEVAHLGELMTTAGMLFASGSFDSHRLGECHLFATCLENAVLVEVDHVGNVEDPEEEGGRLRWIVTPDDPEAFVAALRDARGSDCAASGALDES